MNRVWCVGMSASLVGVILGGVKNNEEYLLFGVGVAITLFVAGALNFAYAASISTRCKGNVLEVKNGKVLGCYQHPFVYKDKELGDTKLVSLHVQNLLVTRTIQIPIDDIILNYSLSCDAITGNKQAFYDTFLVTDPAETTPEVEIGSHISVFLLNNREWIMNLYLQRRFNGGDHGECATHVHCSTMSSAVGHLEKELGVCGLEALSVTCKCDIKPYVIQ